MRRITLLGAIFLCVGCSPTPSQFPKSYVECLDKAILETKHQLALVMALDHCKRLDPKGEAAYSGWESIPGRAVKK